MRLPLGLEVGESVTMTGSDPPLEQAVMKKVRRAKIPRGGRHLRLLGIG